MNRLITFVCSLALIGACTGNSESVEASAGKPVATTGETTPSAPATDQRPSSNPIKKVFGGGTHDVTLPAGTVLPVALETAVGSDTSRVEQPVSGRLRRAIIVGGAEVLPAGTALGGHVTAAQRPGKVKGRGLIAMRFTQLDTPGAGKTAISTATISRLAPATKQKDALEIIGPAAAGAVIGRLVGGKSAARKGAVIGGGAGGGYVLSTRGKEVRIGKGASLAVKLTAPVTIRVAGR
jgi:hypothetical protein